MTARILRPGREYLESGLVFGLALALRVWFIVSGTVEHALRRSDALEYFNYAVNLVQAHVYSGSYAGDGPLVPDNYRDPGFPLFLAALLKLLGVTDAWYLTVLLSQALLGALTASLTLLIVRHWCPRGWAVAAGVAVALWPHNVAISGFVLSENLFGFALTLSLWLSCRALAAPSSRRWLAAGLAFGATAMVNATITPFGALLAFLLWKRRLLAPGLALLLLLSSLLLPTAWAARGWSLDSAHSAGSRAMINLVQGSWPEYHAAYIAALGHQPEALVTMQAIASEQQLAVDSPAAGLAAIWLRLRAQPAHYLAWYAGKPALLWGWSIRMGWGDIYPYPVTHSIYLSNPVMPMLEALCFALNPMLFLLMIAAACWVLLRPAIAAANPGLLPIGLLAVFETLVYAVLQSEPRYSIPLRPLEMMLAVTALWSILQWRQRQSTIDRSPLSARLAPSHQQPATTAADPVQRGVS